MMFNYLTFNSQHLWDSPAVINRPSSNGHCRIILLQFLKLLLSKAAILQKILHLVSTTELTPRFRWNSTVSNSSQSIEMLFNFHSVSQNYNLDSHINCQNDWMFLLTHQPRIQKSYCSIFQILPWEWNHIQDA